MKSISARSQSGFTFVELIVVLGIFALLASLTIQSKRRDLRDTLQNTAITEAVTIKDAAVFFYGNNNNWPDSANNCAGALNTLLAQGFVRGVTAINPYGNNYTFDCTGGRVLDIGIDTDDALVAAELDGKIGAATRAGDVVTVHVGPPSSVVAVDGLLHRDLDPARPELNQMNTDIDMNTNDLNNVDEIAMVGNADITGVDTLTWGNNSTLTSDQGGSIELGGDNTTAGTGSPYIDFHFNGITSDYEARISSNAADSLLIDAATQTVISSSTIRFDTDTLNVEGNIITDDILINERERLASQGVYDVGIVASQTVITKPTCGSLTPQIFTSGSFMSPGSTAKPMASTETWAENLNATQWRVRGRVLTEDGYQEPTDINFLRIHVTVKCT